MFKKINISSLFLSFALISLIFGYAISNIFIILLVITGIYYIIKNKKYVLHKWQIPILLFFLFEVATLLWTINNNATIHHLQLELPILLLPIFVSQFPKLDRNDSYKIIRWFSIGLIIYFLACLSNAYLIYQKTYDIEVFFYHPLVSVFKNHAIYISLYCSFCILGLINIKKPNIFDLLLICLLFLFLLLLASKNVIISTLVIQLILFVSNKKYWKVKLITLLFCFLCGMCLFFYDNLIKERFLEELNYLDFSQVLFAKDFQDYHWTGTNLRIFQLRLGFDIIEQNHKWIVGLGLGTSQEILDFLYKKYHCEQYYSYNFHNQYMQILVECGVLGLLLLISLIIYCFYKSIRDKNLIIFIFIFLMSILFLTEVVFFRQKGVIFFSLVYTIFFNIKKRKIL